MRLIILSLVLYYVCCGSGKSEETVVKRNAYAFYYPMGMDSKQSGKVCLEIDKDLLPAKVKISFVNATCDGPGCLHEATTDFSCWKVTAPEYRGVSNYYTIIEVSIETKDENVKFTGENKLRIFEGKPQVFIETDRKVYKMGDTVKLRLLALGFDLKPIENYKIQSLQVKSPYPIHAIIKEWKDIATDRGLVQLELQLAPDIPEGQWSITGDGFSTSFEVKKYVLPRFQAIIEGPDSIYHGSKTQSYRVCGKYSYGQGVKGNALLTDTTAKYGSESQKRSKVQELKGGCAKFDIFGEDLTLKNVFLINFSASVTEEGTDQVETASKSVSITKSPYTHVWSFQDRYIKPELPHQMKFSLNQINVPLDSPLVELCYKLDSDGNNVCNNVTMDSTNTVHFTIPPIANVSKASFVNVKARVFDSPPSHQDSKQLKIWYSKSKNAIKLIESDSNPEVCDSTRTYAVLYNSGGFQKEQDVEFKYIVTSRGEIVSGGSIVEKPEKENLNLDEYPNVIGKEELDASVENPVDKFELKIELGKEIYTDAKLLVYYEHDNEVISDYVDVTIKKCTPNKVEAKWTESSLYPGEVGKLKIETDPQSLCSVSSVDKASTFSGSNRQIIPSLILSKFDRNSFIYHRGCIESSNASNSSDNRYYGSLYSPLFDTFEAFKVTNVGIISNMEFLTKICERNRPILGYSPQPFLVNRAPDESILRDDRGSAVRSFFPETWLWDLVSVPESGQIDLDRKLPDSITDWEGNVICVSSKKGLGVSEQIEMKGFKPFFVDVLLPYSIKRNKEVLHLPVPIFNYLNHSLPIQITLQHSDDVVLMDGEAKSSFSMCLGGEDSYTHNYRIKATKLGHVNVTVSADVDPVYSEDCAPKSVIRRRDVVQKPLLVEPEGYPSATVKSALLCANDSSGVENVEWDIKLPENVVQDTVDGKVTFNSDILGPMFQNLEGILVIPTGCGEQTMATLTPNLYVLKYLEANAALTDDIQKKILKNLEIGYQRMLNYVHDDGSFSAFGKRDKEGSMFLTAFVIRSFRQMKKYTFIDDDVINKAIRWVISHQLENGCFDPVHHVLHEMGLASSKNQTTALTSYVLISFLETNTNIDEKILSKAKECLLSDDTVDKYTLAISAYALGLMNLTEEAQKRLENLREVANRKDDLTWWTQSEKSLSANVEVSSYVLMSLLQQDPVGNFGTARSIVAWLQTQMNPRGGFFSTTDTVVGLDAISRYASLINKKEPNFKVLVSTNSDLIEIQTNKRDRSKTDVLPMTSYPNKVKAKIEGDGCVAIQATVNYYLDRPLITEDLKLDITVKPSNSLVELKPCVSYQAPGQINMAIVEVSMPSGYAPDQSSLYELTGQNVVKKFEQIRNTVVFYLTQLGSSEVCMPFKIEENLVVENVANATVKFFDYYKPELSISKSFKLDDSQKNTTPSTA